jgi:hypothetical protein
MQVIHVQCFPKFIREKLRKVQCFLIGINGLKRVTRSWKMMKAVVFQDVAEPMKMLKKCGIWYIKIDI